MDSLKVSISKVFKGSIKSFSRFPGYIVSAIIISIIAIIRINMDWETQRTYSLLFDSIQLSFVLGAVLSMAAVAYDEINYKNNKSTSLFINIFGIIVATLSFLLLYFFTTTVSQEGIRHISTLSGLRLGVAIFASGVAFLYIVSNAKTVDSFSDSFFISHKAFAISAIYGLVIWFKENLNEDRVFKDTFGFDKTYGVYPQETEYTSANLVLKTELIDISDYPLALNININEKMNISNSFVGKDGEYQIILTTKSNGIPKITVQLEGDIIIEKSLEEYLNNLQDRYPLGGNTNDELSFEDMSIVAENENISVLLVFDNINIYSDKIGETTDYYVNINGLYIKYK